MHFDTASVASIIIAVITAVGAYAGTRATVRANRESAEPANWQALTSEMKAFYKERFDAQDERIDALEAELHSLRDYARWLVTLDLPKPPFLTAEEFLAEQQRRRDRLG